MKKLKIFKEDTINFVIQNEETGRRKFVGTTEKDLAEALENYPNINDYQIEVDSGLWAIVINAMTKRSR